VLSAASLPEYLVAALGNPPSLIRYLRCKPSVGSGALVHFTKENVFILRCSRTTCWLYVVVTLCSRCVRAQTFLIPYRF